MYNWWTWFFIIVGVLTTVILILKWFWAIGRSLPPLHAPEVPGVERQEFMQLLSMAVDADTNTGGTAEVLNNGDGFFPVLLEEIRAAEYSVSAMAYIWQDGKLARELFSVLTEKAEQGIQVRVMIDGLGGARFPRSLMRQLRDAGGDVRWFSPLKSMYLLHFNRRNHRRAFVIDGRVAFTGGMAIADYWTGDANNEQQYRDMMLRLTGNLATTVQEAFMQLWVNITGDIPYGPGFLPCIGSEGEPRAGAIGDGEKPLQHLGISHNPSIHVQPLRQVFWLSFRAARETIYIANSYFAPDRFTRQELMDQAKAGVDVRLLLPSHHTDARLVRWFAQRYYDEFLQAGIRIYEYQPTMMHSKYLVVDGHWTLTGSANLDVRSFQLNNENILGIQHREFGDHMKQLFHQDLQRASEITLEQWRARPWWHRVRESLVLPLWAQY